VPTERNRHREDLSLRRGHELGEAVPFMVRVKEQLEDPARMVLEVWTGARAIVGC